MSTDKSSPDPKKKKRSPGRPKAESTFDESIQIRLSSKQLAWLDEQVLLTKLTRSAIIRAALDKVHVLPAAPSDELREERQEQYRQLVKMGINLNQLVVLARTMPVVELRARATIDQVQQVLAKIYKTYFGV